MRKISLVLVLIMLVASATAIAAAGDRIVRFGIGYSSPTGDHVDTENDPPYYYESTVEADAAIGPFIGFEYLFTDSWGADVTLMHTNHDIEECYFETYDGEIIVDEHQTVGEINVMPLFISAHYHFTRDMSFDLYAGPSIGYVMYGDFEFLSMYEMPSLDVDDDFGVGAVIGVDVPFGTGNWNFSSVARYMATGAEVSESEVSGTVDIDPWIIQVGVGYRF